MSAEELRQISANALNELETKEYHQIAVDKIHPKDLALFLGILENDGMKVVETYPTSLIVELEK
jgi:hypothetical protein